VTTVLVLVILGVIWAAVLLPPYLQNRRESRPGDSIATFRSQLHTLERTTPGSTRSNLSRLDVGRYEAPRYQPRANVAQLAGRRPAPSPAAARRAEARRRRRDVFLTLLGAVGVTLVLGIAMGGIAWMVFGIAVVALGLYTAMLVSIQHQTAERDSKVRYMPPTAARRPEAQLAIRRYGS
jgi:hypothetical protein